MTNISASAESARESVRAADGTFGIQVRTAPEARLDASASPADAWTTAEGRLAAAREKVRRAKLDLQDEAASQVRRIGAVIPGAVTVAFQRQDDYGTPVHADDATTVVFDSVQDADGEIIDLTADQETNLWALAGDFDPYDAELGMDGADDEMLWIDLTRQQGSDGDERGPVDELRSRMPDGVDTIELSYAGDGTLEIIGATDSEGNVVQLSPLTKAELSRSASRIGDRDVLEGDDGLPPFLISRA